MSTNRNTKGQFARKTAPKKAVKKPTQLDRIEKLYFNIIKAIDASDEAMEARLDQIQRDIDLLKSGSSFMQEVEQHRAQLEEQGLEDGDYCDASPELLADLWKMGFEKDLGGFRPFVNWHAKKGMIIPHDVISGGNKGRSLQQIPPADFIARARVTAKKLGLVPEEPKAEPWEPKVGSVVVDVADPRRTTARVMECLPIGVWKIHWPGKHDSYLSADQLAPATVEEIAAHERSEKLKKLVRGCRVDTPDGEGIYLGRDGSECGREHIVSPDNSDSFWVSRYDIDQLTPLT